MKLRGDCHCVHGEATCPSPPHRQTGHNGTGERSCFHGPLQILREYARQYHILPTYLMQNRSGHVCLFTSAELDIVKRRSNEWI